jgi:FixJ family two-component response regulator
LTVFVLDTHKNTIDQIRTHLSDIGYLDNTIIFKEPGALLAAYMHERPGMVFLRMGEPKTEGLHTAKVIRQMDMHAKIVFISKSKGYVDFAWETGAAGYLMEPFTQEDFMMALSRAG